MCACCGARKGRVMDGKGSLSRPMRLLTYMSPDVPIAVFELVRNFLEDKFNLKSYLMTESRWDGPPEDRTDPLTGDDADIVFLSSTSFLEQREKSNKFMELCQAAPVYTNSRASNDPVCFSEIVVLASKVQQGLFKDFASLQGSRWAYVNKKSGTGSQAMLAELKKHGYNANFFSSAFESGSHLNSLQMLLSSQVDVVSVSSVVLAAYRIAQPHLAEQMTVLESLGPFPVYAIVFNSRLPATLKEEITKGLQSMATEGGHKWGGHFMMLGIKGFVQVTDDSFRPENEVVESVKTMSIAPAYY